MASKSGNKTIERKIYFYKVVCTEDGKQCKLSKLLKKYIKYLGEDMTNLAERGLAIPYYEKYHFLDIVQDKEDKDLFKGKFYSLRATDFPYLFNIKNGDKNEIPSKEQDTLMEQTHFVYFANQNLIVSEYNYYGAKIEQISCYLQEILSKRLPSKTFVITITPIIIPEYFKQIVNCTSLSKVQFKVAHPGLKILEEENIIGLSDVMQDNMDENSEFSINIEITGAGRGKPIPIKETKPFLQKIVSAIKKGNQYDVTRQNDDDCAFKSAKIKAYSPQRQKSIPYDLLDEKLLHTCWVKKISPKSKYVDSDEMFEAILNAYNNQKTDALKYMEKL